MGTASADCNAHFAALLVSAIILASYRLLGPHNFLQKLPSRRLSIQTIRPLRRRTEFCRLYSGLNGCERMPRYKVLKGVAHNIGHSFTSLMNYAIDDYTMGHVLRLARQTGRDTLIIDLVTVLADQANCCKSQSPRCPAIIQIGSGNS